MKQLMLGWLLLLATTALAQNDYYRKDPPKPTRRQYVITLQDGSQLRGELIRQDSLEAIIKTSNLGQVTVKADQIISMVAVDSAASTMIAAGYPNLFPQYMLVSPTAYQAERGKLYFRTVDAFFSQFDYGINDNWSVGAGFFTFDPTLLFTLRTRISFPVSDRLRLGVQGQFGSGRNLLDNRFLGGVTYIQGIASIGSSQHNVTVGVGAIRFYNQFSTGQLLTIGTVQKVSPVLTFIGEVNTAIGPYTNTNLAVSGGLRFDRRRHAFDLSASFSIPTGGGFPIIPLVAYQLRIGR